MNTLHDEEVMKIRAQRMKTAFDVNALSEAEVFYRMTLAKERGRLDGRRRQRVAPLIWGAVAAFLCSGSALAIAIQTGSLHLTPPSTPVEIQELPSQTPPAHSVPLSPYSRDTRIAAPTREQDLDQDEPREASELGEVINSQRSFKARATSKPSNHAIHSPDIRALPSHEPAPVTPEEISASWERVAGALREGDDSKARQEVDGLVQSDDAETRDSARLIQLRIELGSATAGTIPATLAQRALAESLAEHGATASIRASARRLLKRMTDVKEK